MLQPIRCCGVCVQKGVVPKNPGAHPDGSTCHECLSLLLPGGDGDDLKIPGTDESLAVFIYGIGLVGGVDHFICLSLAKMKLG